MSIRLRFHPAAEGELDETAQYYGRIDPNLARAFLHEMERCVQAICDHPKSCPVIGGTLTRQLARRFPYGVIYCEESDEIRTLAIAHLKRRPLYWAGRQ